MQVSSEMTRLSVIAFKQTQWQWEENVDEYVECIGPLRSLKYSRSLELWNTEKHLYSGAQVAAVAQVFDARISWAIDGL